MLAKRPKYGHIRHQRSEAKDTADDALTLSEYLFNVVEQKQTTKHSLVLIEKKYSNLFKINNNNKNYIKLGIKQNRIYSSVNKE